MATRKGLKTPVAQFTLPFKTIKDMNSSLNIGIDFGGVLSAHDKPQGSTTAEHVNTTIDIPDAIENMLKLKLLGHKLYLISFCGKSRAIITKQSLESTLISGSMSCADIFDGIYFVKNKSYKKELCEYLNCHFMIDDRLDVLENILTTSCKTVPILFGSQDETMISALDWNSVTKIITETAHFETITQTGTLIQSIDSFIHKL